MVKLHLSITEPGETWIWARTVQEAKAAIKHISSHYQGNETILINIGAYGPRHPVQNTYYLDFLEWLEKHRNKISNPILFNLNLNDPFEQMRARQIINLNWKELNQYDIPSYM